MNFLVIASIIACLMVIPVKPGSPCPPATDILPCSCHKSEQDTIINCVYHDPELLKLAFKAISAERTIVDFFNVSSTRLNVVEANFFQNITVRNVMVFGDRWSAIDDDAFTNQERSLSRVTIKESLLTSVPVEAIAILKELEYFGMVNSEVSEIDAGAFDSIDSAEVLKILDLRSNYIKRIGDGAFAKLIALQILYLTDNRITTLQADVLPSPSRIKILNIANNRLESIPKVIDSLPTGSVVQLNNNHIDSLSGQSLRTMITNKLSVYMKGNSLKCDCSMSILTGSARHYVIGQCTTPSGAIKLLTSLTSSDFSNCFLLFPLNRH